MPSKFSPAISAAAWLMLILLGLLWGGSFFFARIAVQHIPPVTLAFLRFLVAALTLHAFIAWRTQDLGAFRTSPLRNAALQPAFFHNGAFTRIEDAIRHHLDVFDSARDYDPRRAGVDPDLRHRLGPIEPVLARVDPLLATPIELTPAEFANLVAFVRDGLLDERARKHSLCRLAPDAVPSGLPTMRFEGCPGPH